jgi:1,4-alpha-glucan branching enzyme
MPTKQLDEQTVLDADPWLRENVPAIIHRHDLYRAWKDKIDQLEGGYENFTKGYLKFGLNVDETGQVTYREWAPNAQQAVLIGDFSESSSEMPGFGLPDLVVR